MKTKRPGIKGTLLAAGFAALVFYVWILFSQRPISPIKPVFSSTSAEAGQAAVYLESGDGAAITSAILGLPPEGGLVVLGPSLFPVSQPVIIDRDDVELRGCGDETILRLTDGANCPVIVIGSTTTPIPRIVRGVAVRNLGIDGNRGGQQFECWGGACDGGGLTFIRNNGISVRGAEDILIEKVVTHNARSGGIVLEKHCSRVHIADFESYNNEFDGLAAYETEDCTFERMKLHHNRSAAVSFDWKFSRNLITDSQFTENGGQGIFMRDSLENRFENLLIRDNGEQGIFIAETREISGSSCRRNTFDRVTVTGNGTQGIRINDASCTENRISNSQVSGNKLEDISLAADGLLIGSETVTQ